MLTFSVLVLASLVSLSSFNNPAERGRWLSILFVLCGACSVYDPRLVARIVSIEAQADGGADSGSNAVNDAGENTSPTHPAADGGGPASCVGSQSDPDNCGRCGHVCRVDNGVAECTDGECKVKACAFGLADCDADPGNCETTTTTLTDCGGCDVACGGLSHASATCISGSCGILKCAPGYADCDGQPGNGCEAVLGSLQNCGGCNVPCDKASCAGGVCTSIDCGENASLADCDGDGATCEVNLASDVNNCGRCGVACQVDPGVTAHGTLSCSTLGCAITCDSGYVDCDTDYHTGCEPFVDSDQDGTADCMDRCPNDATKQSPGVCGCGTAETDADADGTPDCKDSCPLDPTQIAPCLTFAPANFDPKPINWSAQPSSTLNCGTTTLNTTDPDGSGPLVATITNWCGTAPVPVAQNQASGPQAVIIALRSLTIAAGNTLRLIGSRPVILAVDGAVAINGSIDASGSDVTPGAGGNWSCSSSQGGNGSGSTARFGGASGGGGGGFGTAGGKAGEADTDGSSSAGGNAGATRGNTALIPLLGGCAGGQAGDCSNAAAAGGGGFQITASGALDVNGSLLANGGNGALPCGSNDEGGGTGAGSGGAILLESISIDTSGATLQVNGGSGGHNGDYAGVFHCGNSSGGAGSTSASNAGGTGTSCQGGSSGGGGGYGRVRSLLH
jgi:hypothetical protein